MLVNTPKKMGDAHKRTMLKLLYEYESLSRAEIARLMNLSPPAVTSNISVMLEAGTIVQIGSGTSEFGRKPILISLNKKFRYVIGVDIREKKLYVVLADFAKTIIDTVELPSLAEQGAEKVIEQIKKSIDQLLEQNQIQDSLGVISIAAPGLVNSFTGQVEFSTVVTDLNEYNLQKILNEVYGVPVLVENDVDMAVKGEYEEGRLENIKDMVYIKIGDGAAARIISNGKLLRGRGNAAGEIGYMLIDRSYFQNSFNARGALEKEICNSTINARYRELAHIRFDDKEYYTLGRIINLASQKNLEAQKILDQILDMLGRVIVNISAIIDTEVVVLGGELEELSNEQILELKKFVGSYVPYVPDIRISRFKELSGVKGCVASAIDKILDDIEAFV